ncbi:hypothetical protein [Desulfovibrio litoralis]|uniref:Uncharacterized protein n=1 Tax=Desulfovibrio litoralis DSM 11393 TaxID=1121455 RepID=A0A1M7T8S2_9BACT|nr:hypothetical protein [Desulfovibrio litoralis]SHN67120.1 hypothetical protein SAMN02745728_01736 [Desulfovibrio litoralis DSM 11393]
MTNSWINGVLENSNQSGLWTPKQNKIVVGRDVGRISATGFETQKEKIVLGDGDDVAFKSKNIFDLAKRGSMSGYSVKNFRDVSDNDLANKTVTNSESLFENDKYFVAFFDNTITIYEKNDDPKTPAKLIISTKIKDDTLISWGEDGVPQITTGAAAKTDNVLKATGINDILIRKNASKVEAGTGTIVLNLAKGGTFSGGSNVTYKGFYDTADIVDDGTQKTFAGYFTNMKISTEKGNSIFSGVFEDSTIKAGKGADTFSGYFARTEVSGGDGDNLFNGMFMDHSKVIGGEDNDTFYGRFIESSVDGGKGDDSFGSGARISQMSLLYSLQFQQSYMGLESDFINSEIDAGEGNDTFKGIMSGGSINLNKGNDKAEGIFQEASVDGSDGDDNINAWYSEMSHFSTGEGNDAIMLETGSFNTVNTGKGYNSIIMGANEQQTGGSSDADMIHRGVIWMNSMEMQPIEAGEQHNNHVNATEGESTVVVRDGKSEHVVVSGSAENLGNKDNSTTQATSNGSEKASENIDEFSPYTTQSGIINAIVKAEEQNKTQAQKTEAISDAKEKTENKQDAVRPTVKQYSIFNSGEKQNTGLVATTVTTSNGENLSFDGIVRRAETEKKGDDLGMVKVMRYANAQGYYESQIYKIF